MWIRIRTSLVCIIGKYLPPHKTWRGPWIKSTDCWYAGSAYLAFWIIGPSDFTLCLDFLYNECLNVFAAEHSCEDLTLLPHSEKTCVFRKVGSFFYPNDLLLRRNSGNRYGFIIQTINIQQAAEAVLGQKRPPYAVVRLIVDGITWAVTRISPHVLNHN